MQMAVIQGTEVVNIIEADATFQLPGFTLVPYQPPGFIGGQFLDGVFSAPPPSPVVVPDSVSARQFHVQLAVAGLTAQVAGWVATQSAEIQAAFNFSGGFLRADPMMADGFTALGFTSDQIDAFFTAAALL